MHNGHDSVPAVKRTEVVLFLKKKKKKKLKEKVEDGDFWNKDG